MPPETTVELRETLRRYLKSERLEPAEEQSPELPSLSREEFCRFILQCVGGTDKNLDSVGRDTLQHLIADRFTGSLHFTYDIDKTIIDQGQKISADGLFNPGGYFKESELSSTDMNNIDLVILTALFGTAVTFQTGKEANVWPMATYITRRIEQLAQWLDLETYPGGRLKCLGGDRPVAVLVGVGNGGMVLDITAPTKAFGTAAYFAEYDNDKSWPPDGMVVYKPIELSAWEWLYDHRDLLRASTKLSRRAALVGIESLDLPDSFFVDPANRSHIESMVRRAKKTVLEDIPIEERKLHGILVNNVLANHGVPGYSHDPRGDHIILGGRIPPHKTSEVADTIRQTVRTATTDQRHRPRYDEKVDMVNYVREIAAQLSEDELNARMELQSRIRDFALFTTWSTKANLVLDLDVVTGKNGDTTVRDMWEEATQRAGKRITIRNEQDLFEAFSLITRNAPFHWFRSVDQEQVFIDISALGDNGNPISIFRSVHIDKKESARLCKNYIQAMYTDYGVPPDKLYSAQIGDNASPWSNDHAILFHTGGGTVSRDDSFEIRDDGWPIKWCQVFGGHMKEIEFTRQVLLMQLYARIGNDIPRLLTLQRFLLLLSQDLRLTHVDIPNEAKRRRQSDAVLVFDANSHTQSSSN